MIEVASKVIVFFEEPFWVGLFKRRQGRKLYVSKVTFGAEPKDYEVHDFVLERYYDLKFSPAVIGEVKEPPKNPKKLRREVEKQMECRGMGTKSQQALKLWQEQNKIERKAKSKEEKLMEEQRLFELRQIKKREKHKGH